MIITTKLAESEIQIIREEYKKIIDIKKNFPNYVHMDALNEKIWLLHDLFGEEFFK